MGHSNGKITAPVSLYDISATLGVPRMDLGYLCSNNHGKTNRYSFKKPYAIPGNDMYPAIKNEVDYVKSVRLKTYTIGDPVPATALADYAVPDGSTSAPYRQLDFDGYDHDVYPHTCDLSSISGTTIDTDHPNKRFPISYRLEGGPNLFEYLVNADRIISQGNGSNLKNWYFSLLVIAKYGSDTRYYLGNRFGAVYTSMSFPLFSFYRSIRKEMVDIDISRYTCTVLAVAWTYDNQIEVDGYFSLPNKIPSDRKYKFTILPQVGAINPIATNVKLTKPISRVEILFVLIDNSDGYETYFPDPYAVQAYLEVNIGNNTIKPELDTTCDSTNVQDFRVGYEDTPLYGKRGWIIGDGEYLFDEGPMTALASMVAAYEADPNVSEYIKPITTGNYDSSRDEGQGASFEWNTRNLKDYENEICYFRIDMAFLDPYFRPDNY